MVLIEKNRQIDAKMVEKLLDAMWIQIRSYRDDADLRWARSLTFLAGTASLLVGLVWDAIEGSAR